VGAELLQQPGQAFYWRERNDEVDFVYQYRDALYAIEVKSGRKKSAKGLEVFCAKVPEALRVIITPENFAQFSSNPRVFLRQVAL
jgi:predicted AAA+ superfamily ATPase